MDKKIKRISERLPDHSQLEEILNVVPIPIFLKDIDGLFQNCNKAYEDYIGLKKEALVGKSVYDITPPKLADIYHCEDREVLDSCQSRIYPLRVSKNRELMVHKSPYQDADGRICGLVGAIMDVTEQKKAEKQLRDRIQFEALISFISTNLLKATPETMDHYINLALERIGQFLGVASGFIVITSGAGTDVTKSYEWHLNRNNMSSGSLSSSYFLECFHDYYDIYKSGGDEASSKNGTYDPAQIVHGKTKRLLFPMRHGNSWLGFLGLEYAVNAEAELSPEQMTQLGVITEIFINTLQRQRTEEALRLSERRNKLLIEAIPDVIVITTPDCEILDFKVARNFKYADNISSYPGRKAEEVLPPTVAALYRSHVSEAFRTRQMISFEYEMPIGQTEIRFREARIIVISEKEALIIIRDITEIREALSKLQQTQLQLVQQDKLAGIGQMAAGVAHEINNPLGFVSSNFEILQKYVGRLSEYVSASRELYKKVSEENIPALQPGIEQIFTLEKRYKLDYILQDLAPIFQETNEGLTRVGNIVKALRLFSRVDQRDEFAEYDLNEGIKNSLTVARNEIKYSAAVQENLTEIPVIKAIGGQINQVLLNIILNAVHAIRAKGLDTLGLITINTYADERYVYCSIQDSGTGIPEAVRKDIFNPFFTTKPVGQGTGLGLSISYDIIVNKHHGEISFTSQVGVGTTFLVKLPLNQQAEETA